MVDISAADDNNHLPEAGASEHWQESFVMLLWYDPVQKIGGFQHAGMQRVRGIADAWSWISHNGKIVEKFHNNNLALPEDDYSDMRIGPIHLRSEQPLTHRTLLLDDEGVSANLQFVAATKTIGLSYDTGGSAIGSGHWENFGCITGTVTIDGEEHQINARAFQDRSWGARDWASLYAYRWNWASFGDELILSVYYVNGVTGGNSYGHVFDHGEWREVKSVDFVVEMAKDGVSPIRTRAEIWMHDGSGYMLHGECDATSVQTHRDNYMMANACVKYSMGGRLGAGFMEISELKRPNDVLAAVLAKANR